MFTAEQISKIRRLLREGVTPEQVAAEVGVSLTTFRAYLANSGYRVTIWRDLEIIRPVEDAPDTTGLASKADAK